MCQVLTQLKNANLSIKLSKSQFCFDSVEYLGFIVSKQGVSASSEKIKPILNYQIPTNLTESERFLGMTGVYQRFISQYQIKTEPLRRSKKKDSPFIWPEEQNRAFTTLKEDLCLLPLSSNQISLFPLNFIRMLLLLLVSLLFCVKNMMGLPSHWFMLLEL